MLMRLWLLALLSGVLAAPALAALAGTADVTVSASFVPPAKGKDGAIRVSLLPKDPEVHVNEQPAPRLKLDPMQKLLLDKQPLPPSHAVVADPADAKYLDPLVPVSFPVAWAGAPPGAPQTITGSVVYFYCSKREGWCRRGSAEVEVEVKPK